MLDGYKTYIFTLILVVTLILLLAAHYYFKPVIESMGTEVTTGLASIYIALFGAIIMSLRQGMKNDNAKLKEELLEELRKGGVLKSKEGE